MSDRPKTTRDLLILAWSMVVWLPPDKKDVFVEYLIDFTDELFPPKEARG